jgi:uncharacterized protein YdhG (YjbR/CyaY superfamily)
VNKRLKFLTIDDYFVSIPAEAKLVLEEIRKVIKAAVPEATETISYHLPAFKHHKVFIYFAAFKKHIGMYPPVKGDIDLIQKLAPYANEKGNLKFPLNQPIPYELISRIAISLSLQYKNEVTSTT